jgi:hypothetical protein
VGSIVGCSGADPEGNASPDAGVPESGAPDGGVDGSTTDGSHTDAKPTDDAADAHVPTDFVLTRRFPTAAQPVASFKGCMFASPLLYESAGAARVIVADASGTIAAIDPDTGATDWSVRLPSPPGEDPLIAATPVRVGARLVVAYHTIAAKSSGPHVTDSRVRHRVAVVDLDAKAIDPTFAPFDVSASVPTATGNVDFFARHALARSALVHAIPPGSTLGRVYVTYGNARDLQPWHGWMFEIDLDSWHEGKSAIAGVLLTTPEANCGPENGDGARQRVCGGGLWTAAGPLIVPHANTYDVVITPGNGQLDIPRGDYSNTILRTGPGLQFDHGCDETACKTFDRDEPGAACITSCKNLYVPRLMPGEAPPRPESGACAGMTVQQCWEHLDFADGSTPVLDRLPSGRQVFAYATKEGVLSLVDADHMGTLFDRVRLVEHCGTKTDVCQADWAGMIVTQPAVAMEGGDPMLVVPTFMFDHTHPAGVFGVRISEASGTPKLSVAWRAPEGADAAVKRFRMHPSRPVVASPLAGGPAFAFVVEANPDHRDDGKGRLLALRASDGHVAADEPLDGPGVRFVLPLVRGATVYVPSCDSDSGPSHLEAYDFGAK